MVLDEQNVARRERDDERGSMLIVALGILTLLSVLALTFVSIMRLEQTASTNYVDGVKARLIAEGGLEAAAANIRARALGESYSNPNADWVYARGEYWLPIEQATVLGEPGDAPNRRASFAGTLAASYNQGIDRYKVKVIDAQTQFNLNSRYEVIGDVDQVYVRFLDALGVAISKRTATGTGGTGGRNPIWHARYPKSSPNPWRGGEAIYRFRQSREGQRFNSKSELLEVLANEDDFNLLQDYVTVASWFDPKTVTAVPMDGLNNKPWSDVQIKELRSPININLATTEIIAANLAGIAGRAIYLYTGDYDARPSRLQDVDAGTSYATGQHKEEVQYGTVGVLVYIAPFGYQPGPTANDPPIIYGALDFARKIKNRIQAIGPFRTFAEWEDFVDATLTDGYLEGTRDPETNRFVFPGHDRGANEPIMLQLDEKPLTTPSAADVKRQRDYRAWFYEAVRSMIKANFNPNARLSGWNPDHAVYLPCDKGSLLYPADINAPSSTKAQRQTNEWCLSSKGVFEITALGEVLGPPPEDPTKGTDRIIYAQAKVQGVVQLYDTITHTSQRDFERNGYTYLAEREVVKSYPIAKLLWDPRAEGLGTTQEQLYLNDGSGQFLHASDEDGYLQLDSRAQIAAGPGIDDNITISNHVVELGNRRFELLFQDRHIENPGSTLATNDDVFIADSSGGVRNAEGMGLQPSAGRPKNGFGWPYGTAPLGVAPATRSSTSQLAWKWDTVTPDGYLNSELRETTLWYRASDENSVAMPATPDGRLRGKSAPTGGNVTPTPKGGVEFWYKPDFDWSLGPNLPDQRLCGLLATSHITQNEQAFSGGASPQQGSWTRGTQMFITRNSSGDLRITRLYFEVVGPSGHPQEEPMVTDPTNGQKITFTQYLAGAAGGAVQYPWPPAELLLIPPPYNEIKFSRTDHWVPYDKLRDWKAHEWHHIAAYWDDKAGEVWLWLDGTPYTVGNGGLIARNWPVSAATGRAANARYVPYATDPANPTGPPVPANQVNPAWPAELPSFVRLNALTGPTTSPSGVPQPQYEDSLWPKDQVMIGCVRRDQAVVGGLFKFEKDAILPANGTIDDVRFFDGMTPPGSNANPRRFTASRYDVGTEVGYWTNEFDLSQAFQGGAAEIALAGIHFTAYLPRRYAQHTFPNGTGSVRIEFEIRRAEGSVERLPHWTDTFASAGNARTNAPGDAAEIQLSVAPGVATPVRVRRNDKLVYRVHFTPAMTPSGVAFASPVLDDVSLVYYLPNVVTLLKERVIN